MTFCAYPQSQAVVPGKGFGNCTLGSCWGFPGLL